MPYFPKGTPEILNDPICDHGESIEADIEKNMKRYIGEDLFGLLETLEVEKKDERK